MNILCKSCGHDIGLMHPNSSTLLGVRSTRCRVSSSKAQSTEESNRLLGESGTTPGRVTAIWARVELPRGVLFSVLGRYGNLSCQEEGVVVDNHGNQLPRSW